MGGTVPDRNMKLINAPAIFVQLTENLHHGVHGHSAPTAVEMVIRREYGSVSSMEDRPEQTALEATVKHSLAVRTHAL
ncbi:hypothetical protein DPMN_005668 [Dreissena polymorpha]|uniref:Uncharacterized protein n=1 Tax=Dreissena polymorpha TaxID=45954 RepID=A0A9D4MTY9_DREPO|nr:hypothetical protein DPMN_005668 [Dreissena polymorpha]